jgi:hypothetical protein
MARLPPPLLVIVREKTALDKGTETGVSHLSVLNPRAGEAVMSTLAFWILKDRMAPDRLWLIFDRRAPRL